jgi:hypothetical protein
VYACGCVNVWEYVLVWFCFSCSGHSRLRLALTHTYTHTTRTLLSLFSHRSVTQVTLRKEEHIQEAYNVLQQLVGNQMMQILDASAEVAEDSIPQVQRRMSGEEGVMARHHSRAESLCSPQQPELSSSSSFSMPCMSKDDALSSEDWELLLRGASNMVFFKVDTYVRASERGWNVHLLRCGWCVPRSAARDSSLSRFVSLDVSPPCLSPHA